MTIEKLLIAVKIQNAINRYRNRYRYRYRYRNRNIKYYGRKISICV